ncbi:MAG: hypothetical protein MMC23_001521 [Stictis urceolatum]|nr:hypothetical protein [Stictis urceolata]
MRWTLSGDFGEANYAPVINPNGSTDLAPVSLNGVIGNDVYLDASASKYPDGDELEFDWFAYPEVDATQWNTAAQVAGLNIERIDGSGAKVKVTVPENDYICKGTRGEALNPCRKFHLILVVKDCGSPQMRAYRTLIIQAIEG